MAVFFRFYLGSAVAANKMKIGAHEDWRGGDLEADRAFQLLLLGLDLAVDELEQLQVWMQLSLGNGCFNLCLS